MSILNEDQLLGAPAGSSQYQIQRSLRFNSADSAYLSRTPASAGNRKTWTWSGWVKRSALGTNQVLFGTSAAAPYTFFGFRTSGDELRLESDTPAAVSVITTSVYRDAGAWMHIVFRVDTTQATSTDRVKIYVNGAEQPYGTSTYPAQNADLLINDTQLHSLSQWNSQRYFSGYLADIHFIDGQALTPASFGEFNSVTGQWIPKAYTGTYGTNGFKLDFADNSAATAAALGKDTSGNGNNWTPNNLSVTAGAGNDSLVDTPTSYGTDTGVGGEVRGNYATLNPLQLATSATLSNGNLDLSAPAASGTWYSQATSVAVASGNFYWEAVITTASSACAVGITSTDTSLSGYHYPGYTAFSYGYHADGYKYNNGVPSAAYGATFTSGDVIGISLNLSTGALIFYKNGVSQGTAYTVNLTKTYYAIFGYAGTGTFVMSANFGQRPFAYTAPSGFKALCDTNLPAPTIVKPSTVMDVKLYTGNGSTQTISGLGFSPDLAWFKCRSNAFDHQLYDTVRGATNLIYSNSTAAEGVVSNGLTAFNSDGVSIGSVTGINSNTATYAAWCWDAGSSTVTNTAGTIQSSVRANASAGFSIVSFSFPSTGPSTIGHGLNAPPSLVIVKSRSISINWIVGHSSAAWTSFLNLNTTAASSTNSTAWNDTAPSSTVVTLGSGFVSGNYGANGVAYCFAPVAGYSAFGSYTGNGSADGPFVYTGFRPRWVMIKATTSVTFGNWMLFDTARNPSNTANLYLQANASTAEGVGGSSEYLNILSNGFKLIATPDSINGSAATYIYAAFAEFPFQYARAR